jgi:large subunit ribosomal protein L22
MESLTYIKNVKVSPRKLRFLLPSIKKLSPAASLDFTFYSPKKGAKFYHKAIKSAITNAKAALKVNEDMLEFKVLTIEEGQKLKRYNPGGRGTAKPYVKRSSHIKIILKAKQPLSTVKPAVVKTAVKKQETKKEEKSSKPKTKSLRGRTRLNKK